MKTPFLFAAVAASLAASSALAQPMQTLQTPAAPQSAAATLPSVAIPPEVDALLRAYEKAWSARDVDGLAALFVADGLALPNGSAPARGAAAIAAEYSKNAGGPLALRPLAFHQVQDLAYMVGGFSQKAGQPDFGKFVLVLRKGSDGTWRIAADMDNMNMRPSRPAPQAAPAAKP